MDHRAAIYPHSRRRFASRPKATLLWRLMYVMVLFPSRAQGRWDKARAGRKISLIIIAAAESGAEHTKDTARRSFAADFTSRCSASLQHHLHISQFAAFPGQLLAVAMPLLLHLLYGIMRCICAVCCARSLSNALVCAVWLPCSRVYILSTSREVDSSLESAKCRSR